MRSVNTPSVELAYGAAFVPWERRAKEDIAIGIPVAAHQESWETIFRTLDQLADQSAHPRSYRVFLHLNSPISRFDCEQFNETRRQLKNYLSRTGPFRVSVSEAAYPDGTTIGEIRRDLWCNILEWAHSKGTQQLLPNNLLGINTDIDALFISENFVSSYREHFDYFPRYDFGYGDMLFSETAHASYDADDFDPAEMIVFHLLELLNEASTFAEQMNPEHVHMVEANTGFRLRAYERIGGIDPRQRTREILELWDRFAEPYRDRSDGKAVAIHVADAAITTDSRRLISAAARGIHMLDCWDLEKHHFGQNDQLRDEDYLRHLVRGAAFKIVRDFDDVLSRYMPFEHFREAAITFHDDPEKLSEPMRELHELIQDYMRTYVRSVVGIVENYVELAELPDLDAPTAQKGIVDELYHRTNTEHINFYRRCNGQKPLESTYGEPLFGRMMEHVLASR